MCPTRLDAVEKRFCGLERTTLIQNRRRVHTASSVGRGPDHSLRRSAIALRLSSGRVTSSNSQKVSNPASDVMAEPVNYGTAVPAIVKWSSVMKLTLQRLHSYTLTSGSSSTPGIVRATIIGLEQFGQSGDWGCIFPPKRTRASLVGSNASPTQCFHLR